MKKLLVLIIMSSIARNLHGNESKKDNHTIVGEWTDLSSVGRKNFYKAVFYETGSLVIVRRSGNFDAVYKLKSFANNEVTGSITIAGRKASFTALFRDDYHISLKVGYDSVVQVHELTRTKRFDSKFHLLEEYHK